MFFFNWRAENKDFNLYKGILMEKKWPKFATFQRKKLEDHLIVIISSRRWPKNTEWFFLNKKLYRVCSQIWLNYFLDDCHFVSITKSLKEHWVGGLVIVQHTRNEWMSHIWLEVRYRVDLKIYSCLVLATNKN